MSYEDDKKKKKLPIINQAAEDKKSAMDDILSWQYGTVEKEKKKVKK